MKKIFNIFFGVAIAVMVIFLFVNTVNAQMDIGDDPLGIGYIKGTGLGLADPRMILAGIIKFALSLIGMITMLVIMLAGFKWMTSGGNDEKVGESKRMIVGAVMGLILILASFSIVQFLVGKFSGAIGAASSIFAEVNQYYVGWAEPCF